MSKKQEVIEMKSILRTHVLKNILPIAFATTLVGCSSMKSIDKGIDDKYKLDEEK